MDEKPYPRRPGTSDGTPHSIARELTPEPATLLPRVATRDQLDRMTVPEQIQALVDAQTETGVALAANARAIAYEQDQRNEARRHGEAIAEQNARITRIEPALQRAQETATIVEGLRDYTRELGSHVFALVKAQERDDVLRGEGDKASDRILKAIGGVDERAGRIEASYGRIESDLKLLSQRVDTLSTNHADRLNRVEARATGAETRLNSLETHNKISVALTRREKTRYAGIGAALTTAGAAISGLAKLLYDHWH